MTCARCHCLQVLVVSDGVIAEQGTHLELLNAGAAQSSAIGH